MAKFGLSVRLWLLCLAASFAACSSQPTSVLVSLVAAADAPLGFERLHLDVFDSAGRVVHDRPLQPVAAASLTLPGSVVLYPPAPGRIRLLARGYLRDLLVAEGVGEVEVLTGSQATLVVTLFPGRLGDYDGDGVPDAIDNCGRWANPTQQMCPDGSVPPRDSGGTDLPSDGGPVDAAVDGATDLSAAAEVPGVDLAEDAGVVPEPDRGRADTTSCQCPLGCQAGEICRQVKPANGLSWEPSRAVQAELGGKSVLDTSLCEADFGSGDVVNGICVMYLKSLTVKSGGALYITGRRAAALLVEGDATIEGNAGVVISATGLEPGPGGYAGGTPVRGVGPGQTGSGPGGGSVCACGQLDRASDCGGGGAGFGAVGAPGGAAREICGAGTSSAGVPYGEPSLEPLVGGSGGASGGELAGDPQRGGRGGGGGGALQLTVGGTLTLEGTIDGGGGGGEAGSVVGNDKLGGAGGGGGSGGAVLLEAPRIVGSGAVAVNGGGGGGSDGNSCIGESGRDGSAFAGGGTGGAGCYGVDGGAGANALRSAGPGSSAGAGRSEGGGGGGGGLGRIRFNCYPKCTGVALSVSGTMSVGVLATE